MATDIPENVRNAVYARDRFRCRWCGRTNAPVHVHHIDYRSAGGGHVLDNLITLCVKHHQLVHTNKNLYPPLLQQLVDRTGVTGMDLARRQQRSTVVHVDFSQQRRLA